MIQQNHELHVAAVTVKVRQTGKRSCMSGSNLWLAKCLPLSSPSCDATINQMEIKLRSSVCEYRMLATASR